MTVKRIAAALLVALWIVCVWRAATQSIVHDEALTYQLYLAGPASEMFTHFDANHHFLNTLLMRVSTALFGFTPLAMRLPALAGAALFFAALFRFCRWAFGESWLLLLAVAAVSLNPFILDFMVAARGYGLALAFWMWALALIAPQLGVPAHDRKSVAIAGACAALSVTANLIFALPVFVLAAIVIWFSAQNAQKTSKLPLKKVPLKHGKNPQKTRVLSLDFMAPAAAVAIVFFLIAPLEHASGEHFYAGASSIAESLRSLAATSIDHSGPNGYHALASRLIDPIAFALAPAILILGGIAGWRSRNLPLILTTIPALGSAVLLLALHLILGTPFPADRTGIYFIPAVALAVIASGNFPARAIRAAACALAAVMIVCFAVQFDPRMFVIWKYDADAEHIAERLVEIAKTKPVTIANSWQLEPALNFYRETRHLDALSPFTRVPMAPGFDLYILAPQDRAQADSLGWNIIYTGPVSKTVIAAANPSK